MFSLLKIVLLGVLFILALISAAWFGIFGFLAILLLGVIVFLAESGAVIGFESESGAEDNGGDGGENGGGNGGD